jgi:hypothetical protein
MVVQERVLSIHEASCVLISYLCELSSKARQQISHSEGVIESLVAKVFIATHPQYSCQQCSSPSGHLLPSNELSLSVISPALVTL